MRKSNDELTHWGVLGMHWGSRKSSTERLAEKDAKRHVDAKMFYGETAGTRRKLLKAELEKKKKTIPGYAEAFNDHLTRVDTAKSAKKAVRDRTRIDTSAKARSLVKKILGVTGSLTVAAGTALYYANKPAVDKFLIQSLFKISKGRVGRYP